MPKVTTVPKGVAVSAHDMRRLPQRAPGIRDIAQATGLSTATISRALSGTAKVAQATRERVLAAVAETGYLPNPAARALTTRRSRTIGAVVPTLAHSIFATFLNSIEQELAKHGYALVIATTGGDAAHEAQRARDLLDLGAEGLIVSGIERDPNLLRLIAERKLPVVATSFYEPRSAVPTIGYDNRALARQALMHLRDLGHQRIAVLHGPVKGNDRTVKRLAGVRAAAGDAHLVMLETSLDALGGSDAARAALSLRPRPTALLCLSDVLALGAMFQAQRAGLVIPGDLSVMGFDGLDWAAVCYPPLTTLQLPTADMGCKAALALVRFLDNGIPIEPLRLPAPTITRGSTAPPTGS